MSSSMSIDSNNLMDQIEALTNTVNFMTLDNSILQKYIDKKTIELGNDDDDKKKKKNKKQTQTTLTPEQKCEIASCIHDDLIVEIDSHRKQSEKMIETLRAVLEETEIRIGELKRDAYEFKRDVVVGAENVRTGKIVAEKVSRYFEDKLKSVDAIIEKLRLKNVTLKSQINRVETQLSHKDEVGDVLHYIDFHQLQIENKQYIAKIDEKNEELLNVKLTAGRTIQALNEYKKKLNDKLELSQWLKNEISTKQVMLEKIQKDLSRANKEVKVENHQKNHLRQTLEEASEMPKIEDYISQKKDMYELETILKTWRKKVEIMEMAAKQKGRATGMGK